ncbi:MAG: 4-alpha-glucanotransferase [Polyangiaceae bacterium]
MELTGKRRAGILAHLTSLPGPHGHGDLGPSAFAFADFLHAAGQTVWQMLPVSPPGFGGSPYDSPSTIAGSAWLVSLDVLKRDGLLTARELATPKALAGRERLLASQAFREERLRRAHARYLTRRTKAEQRRFDQFVQAQDAWLRDHSLFAALKLAHGGAPWTEWDAALRTRNPAALRRAQAAHDSEVAYRHWVQFEFDAQWRNLAEYCRERGILLLGDVPMFVAHDGADTWAHQALFRLDRQGRRKVLAGVPPDAFSDEGQLWGNPVYDWPAMQRDGFEWWVTRFSRGLQLFDALRLDHFIGFRRCYEVAADAKDARVGQFRRVPGEALFDRLRERLGGLPFLAEDLGIVTDEVVRLRRHLELPGMRVLQFAFGDPAGSDYLPHRFETQTAVYTGTHDNDTTRGWYRTLARTDEGKQEKRRVDAYVGPSPEPIEQKLMRAAYASVAALAIVPLQDVLGLGNSARMNVPGTSKGNWQWRCERRDLSPARAARLKSLARTYERV